MISESLWSACLWKHLHYFLQLRKYFIYLTCDNASKNSKYDMFRGLNHRWRGDESGKLETHQVSKNMTSLPNVNEEESCNSFNKEKRDQICILVKKLYKHA